MRILREPLKSEEIQVLAKETFEDMIKVVVDVHREIVAAGGALHADGEEMLLEDGSKQEDLWGANYFPAKPLGKRIEYTSLINQYHAANKGSQTIKNPRIRERVSVILARSFGGA